MDVLDFNIYASGRFPYEAARARATLTGDLSAEQRTRLLEIASRCPVHRTLTSEIDIRTPLRE